MRIALTSLVSGTLFGAGLALGGMTDPARVRGFLDIFGDWDPTLAFVMGGAVIVMAIAWRIVPRMAEPVVAGQFHLPTKSDLTPRLIGGAALFGIGRSEEHTSELQSLMRISYAVFCLKKKTQVMLKHNMQMTIVKYM